MGVHVIGWRRIHVASRMAMHSGGHVLCGWMGAMWVCVEAHCELWACIMRAWTRMGAHAQGESEPPQLRWGAGAVQVAMRWVYSFAITAPMSDLACLGSALPTLLAKSPLGKSELNTCSASEPRSRSARAVPLACL